MDEHDSNTDPIIRMFSVGKYYGSKAALTGVTLDVFRGEYVFLTGPSGAGKTTLLKLLYMAEPMTEGQILIQGMNLSRINKKRMPYFRRKIGVVFQDYKLITTRTVYENVALVLLAIGADKKYIKKKVRHVLSRVGLEDRMNAYPPALSGGEQQRVAVARALCGNPAVVLADEPTGNLDSASAGLVLDLLEGFNAQGGTVLLATHDESLLRRASRILSLEAGSLVLDTGREDPDMAGFGQ
ncbi:MAG: cell division ATP-binding protein FtsE [Deltaproteobacteria bacterium]|nr:cell division ATP-binding protein FtsE [Deltaproteobacteria bacterium]